MGKRGHGPLTAARCLLDSNPESKRVQAPAAPGFYRSCASRRTMGSAHRAGWFKGECCMPPLAASLPMAAKTKQPRLWHRSGDLLESPFMCRLRTNFARLGDPLQGLHMGNVPFLLPVATSAPRERVHVIFRLLCSLTNHVRLPPRRGRFLRR